MAPSLSWPLPLQAQQRGASAAKRQVTNRLQPIPAHQPTGGNGRQRDIHTPKSNRDTPRPTFHSPNPSTGSGRFSHPTVGPTPAACGRRSSANWSAQSHAPNRPAANASEPGGSHALRYACGPSVSSCQTGEGGGGSLKVETSVREKLAPLCRSVTPARRTRVMARVGWRL